MNVTIVKCNTCAQRNALYSTFLLKIYIKYVYFFSRMSEAEGKIDLNECTVIVIDAMLIER